MMVNGKEIINTVKLFTRRQLLAELKKDCIKMINSLKFLKFSKKESMMINESKNKVKNTAQRIS